MSDLLKRISDLTSDVIESEARTTSLYFELNKAYGELLNEKFEDVVGLHVPNLTIFMLDIKNHTEILSNSKFALNSRMDDMAEKERKKLKEQWNECITKIPQKDEYNLEGINTWRISQFQMVPDGISMRKPLFKEEMIKLIAAGFRLGFVDEYGTGSIHIEDNGFTIELWKWSRQKIIHKNTIDDVIIWLTNFFEKHVT